MTHEYAYLVGTTLLALVWLLLFVLRKDLRRAMLWSGGYFFALMTVAFAGVALVRLPAYMTINPGYITPDTIFNLHSITGGYSIEDAFFMFFTGGIVAALYEGVFRKRIGRRHAKHRPHLAVKVGVVAAIAVALLRVNLIYAIIAFGFAGALTIWLQRHDLIRQSLVGGALFVVLYAGAFLAVIALFPGVVEAQYTLKDITGIFVLGIPIEEYLYALSFGLMWTPLYEYAMDIR